jgi:hypothetical protein
VLAFQDTQLGHGRDQARAHLSAHPDLARQLDFELRARLDQPAALAS